MSTSEVGICNQALRRLGHPIIASLGEHSAPAQYCKDLYPSVRDEVLESAPWAFALKRVSLALLAAPAPLPWAYAYQKPVDCVRVVEIVRPSKKAPPIPFTVEGDEILTDHARTTLLFVRSIKDPALFSAQFTSGVAWLLARELAMPLTEDMAKAQQCWLSYQTVVQQAWTSQANQTYLQSITAPLPSWIAARSG